MVTPRPADNSKLFTELQQIVDDAEDRPERKIAVQIASDVAKAIQIKFNKWANARMNDYRTLPGNPDKKQTAISILHFSKVNLERIIKEMGI